MAPPKSLTKESENQGGRKRRVRRRPRRRRCLLKGCEERFRPARVGMRYCVGCREGAKKWRRGKAQQKYRGTRSGKERRSAQSQRYRERMKSKRRVKKSDEEGARVIATNFFRQKFGWKLRPAGVLRDLLPEP